MKFEPYSGGGEAAVEAWSPGEYAGGCYVILMLLNSLYGAFDISKKITLCQVHMQGMHKETPCSVILFYVYGYVKEDIIMSMEGEHAGDAQGDSVA